MLKELFDILSNKKNNDFNRTMKLKNTSFFFLTLEKKEQYLISRILKAIWIMFFVNTIYDVTRDILCYTFLWTSPYYKHFFTQLQLHYAHSSDYMTVIIDQ